MLNRRVCSICGGHQGNPCVECFELLVPAPPLPHADFVAGLPPHLLELHAALVYEGVARLLVSRLKFQASKSSVSWLANAMTLRLQQSAVPIQLVTWAPTTRSHQHQRGFDQSRLLAVALARRLGVPWQALLLRHGRSTQTGLGATQRREIALEPGETFKLVRHPGAINVLMVDDIATTVSTLSAAAQVLHEGGITGVVGVVAAITPKTQGG